MEQGTIFNIQKFCINDGPGIRTTVFLKGCPLECLWCHNPESKAVKPEVLYDPARCLGCRACQAVCPAGCQLFEAGSHQFDRAACAACGACAQACACGALELAGRQMTVDEVLAEVMKDKIFYDNSGGGLTVSGGEPMLQFAFTRALLAEAKKQQLHTCIETCGYGQTARFEELAAYTDLFLFDYKLTDSDRHKRYTGVSNELILHNLTRLDELGARIILRCPIIPTVNDDDGHFRGIAETANRLRHVEEIQIEPYHPLGAGKADKLGKDYALKELSFPPDDSVEAWINTIASYTEVSVKKA